MHGTGQQPVAAATTATGTATASGTATAASETATASGTDTAVARSATSASSTTAGTHGGCGTRGRTLTPLLVDVGAPLGSYYLLHSALGLSVVLSLALSSIVPAVRTIASIAADREVNMLAGLMVAVNMAGIGISFATGDPRMMIAKDSGVSSVIAIAILLSVAVRRPLMSAGLRPFMIKGSADRAAAWDRLSAGCPRFRRMELLFSAIWGAALLAECITRLVGAFTLPVATMVWLSTVFTLGAIGVAITVSGVAARPIEKMIDAEVC